MYIETSKCSDNFCNLVIRNILSNLPQYTQGSLKLIGMELNSLRKCGYYFLLLLLFSNVPNEHYAQFYKDFCSSEASIGNNKLACLSMLNSILIFYGHKLRIIVIS